MRKIVLCKDLSCWGCPVAYIDYDGSVKITDDDDNSVKLTEEQLDILYQEVKKNGKKTKTERRT